MQQSTFNKFRPLPGIKSPTENAALNQPTDCVDGAECPNTDAVKMTAANNATKRKSQTTAGPKTTAYNLRELPLAEVIGEVEIRINHLRTFDKFSNSDCSDDLHYLNASTRCGSNPEVKFAVYF